MAAEGLALKPYRYCTDEHTSANPNCNRFDEGTNLVEIATHFITSYEHNYNRINKRNGRKSFSLYQEGGYLGRVSGNFYDLRLIYESYERIKNDFGVEDGDKLWTEIDFLKDIYDASTLAGQFFASILLTPDVNCAIATAQEPRAPVALFPLVALDANATTCFHPDVEATVARIGEANQLQLVIAGEGGKSFKSRKDSSSENSYADQIDVQGIWVDKMLALEFLFARELGSNLFDKTTQNFLNHPAVALNLENTLAAILLGRGGVEVPFRNAEGFPVEFLAENGTTNVLPVSIEFGKEHNIDVPLAPGLTNYFGMPERQTTFSREMIRSLGRLVPTLVGSADASRFLSTFALYREWPSVENGKDAKEILIKDGKMFDRKTKKQLPANTTPVYIAEVGGNTYFALAANKVAVNSIQGIEYAKILNGILVSDVKKILEMKQAGKKLPKDTPDQIKAVYAMENEVLEAYVNGLIKAVPFYEELLGSLLVR